MILTAFFTAWGDMIRPGSLRVLGLGVALAAGLLITVYAAFAWFLGLVLPETMTLPWIGEIGWVDTFVSWASLGLMLVLSVFLMVPVAAAFTGLFLDDVAEVVETAHYPDQPPVRRLSLAETMRDAMAFLGVVLGANLMALLIYPFVIPFAPVLFLGLNGYLLGREYFHMAALRRVERGDALALYRANKATIWIAGALMAVPLSVPLLNLLVPVLGAATFTHLFHRIRGTS